MDEHTSPSRLEADIDTLDRLLADRHSCRAFLAEPLPRATIERMLATAQRTASWCNAQPWQVHVIGGERLEALRAELMERARADVPAHPELDWPREYRGVHLARRRACGWALYQAVGIGKDDRAGAKQQTRENFRLFGAPHLAVVSCDEALGTHGVMDCGAWVANFMLAATASGVASIAQAALASWPDVLRKHLDIRDDHRIVCGVSFGHEDTSHPANGFRTSRAPIGETVLWYS